MNSENSTSRPHFSGLYCTFPNIEEAKKVAKILISKKMVACVNLFPKINSLYIWQGEIQEDEEVVAWMKTHSTKVEQCMETIVENHSYAVPCICEYTIEGGYPPYLEWLDQTLENKGPV